MSTPIKLIIGVLSLAPILAGFYVLIEMFVTFSSVANAGGSVSPEQLSGPIKAALMVRIVAAGIILLLLVFYLWHLFVRNAGKELSFQLMWLVLFVLFGVVTMPLYWFLYIWPEKPAERRHAQP